jgi:hypothetical protein
MLKRTEPMPSLRSLQANGELDHFRDPGVWAQCCAQWHSVGSGKRAELAAVPGGSRYNRCNSAPGAVGQQLGHNRCNSTSGATVPRAQLTVVLDGYNRRMGVAALPHNAPACHRHGLRLFLHTSCPWRKTSSQGACDKLQENTPSSMPIVCMLTVFVMMPHPFYTHRARTMLRSLLYATPPMPACSSTFSTTHVRACNHTSSHHPGQLPPCYLSSWCVAAQG